MSRVEKRRGFTNENRLTLLEDDIDHIHDKSFPRFSARLDATDRQIQKLVWALVGMTITLATASIMLALNLVAGTT